jgi:hypothetical protein
MLEQKMAKKKRPELPPREMRGLLCVSYPNETKIWRLPRPQAYAIVAQGGKLHPRHEWRAQRPKAVKVEESQDVQVQRPGRKAPQGKVGEVSQPVSDKQKEYWDKKSKRKQKKR